MVDESLKAHLTRALVEKAGMKEPDAAPGWTSCSPTPRKNTPSPNPKSPA